MNDHTQQPRTPLSRREWGTEEKQEPEQGVNRGHKPPPVSPDALAGLQAAADLMNSLRNGFAIRNALHASLHQVLQMGKPAALEAWAAAIQERITP